MLLTSQYDITDTHIHWLRPRYHTLESKQMTNETMETDTDRSDDDGKSMTKEDNDYINEEIKGASKMWMKNQMMFH